MKSITKTIRVVLALLIIASALIASPLVNAFQEGWESSPIGTYVPDYLPLPLIPADEGDWILGDTVSEFPECGPTPHTAEILLSGGNRSLRLTSNDSSSSCADNVWVVLFEVPQLNLNPGFSVPLTSGTIISFEETGNLTSPETGSHYCVLPPCGDTVSLTLEDTRGNMLAYVLQRAPGATPNEVRSFYREVFLDPNAGAYSRNLFADFNTIPDFNPTGATIRTVAFQVKEHGTATIDNICIGTSGCIPSPGDDDGGNLVTSDLWIKAVINTEEKGPINAVWQKGGEDTTSRGDRVIWGHFYASPSDVTWGSENNPDLFVKIWFDVSGRVDVNYFHVSVPDIEVYSDYPYDGTPDEQGTTTMSRRYIRQYYQNGQSYSEENYEDGNPPSGYSPSGNPSGYSTINDLRIGSIINTVEKGPVEAVWRFGGQDTTDRGDEVVWGHFYADPSDVTWGSQDNPDLFVKIWFDVSGRVDVNYFHVSVPDIEVYSDLPDDGTYDQQGTTIMDNRYIRHEYWTGTGASMVGGWGTGHYTDHECVGSEYMSLTFYPNGYYIHWEADDPSESDDNGGGVEYGTYTYDSSSQKLFVSPILDENGCIGLSEDGEQTIGQVEVSGDTLTVYDNGVAECTFERVRDGSSSIVGGWGSGYSTDPSDPDSTVTIYPNGYYIYWDDDGVEYGTYTYDPSSQEFIATPILDENGFNGPSKDGEQTIWRAEVSEDTLTIYDNDVVECIFERVK
jgi:hypothetical protein